MKQPCLIAQRDNPNIAQLYGVDFDQNFINTIRVLCTKYPDSFKFFIPEELFLDIRNGEIPPVEAEIYCKGKSYELDPLQILSERLKEIPSIRIQDYREMQIRIRVKGYDLPSADTALVPLSKTVSAEEQTGVSVYEPEEETTEIPVPEEPSEREKKEEQQRREQKKKDRKKQKSKAEDEKPPKKKKGFFGKFLTFLIIAVIVAAAGAGVAIYMNRGNSPESRLQEALESNDYGSAVSIYNDEIYGDSAKEEKADDLVGDAINQIRDDYLAEPDSHQDAGDNLTTLVDIANADLSAAAQDALTAIGSYQSDAEAYDSGVKLLEEKKYLEAAKVFAGIQEGTDVYDQAQEQLAECAKQLGDSIGTPETDQAYEDAFTNLNEMLKLLSGAASDLKDSITALNEKLSGIQTGYVTYITDQVNEKVAKEAFKDALDQITNAKKVYDCSDFDTLYEEVKKQKEAAEDAEVSYTAEDVTFLSYSGTMTGKDDSYTFPITAPETGNYRIFLEDIVNGFKMYVYLYDDAGKELDNEYITENEQGITCELTGGSSYKIEIKCTSDQGGNYTLKVGQQKPTVDVTEYTTINDSMEFTDQKNIYQFVPENTGVYRFEFSNVVNGFSMDLQVFDSLDYRVGGDTYSISNGEGHTVSLTAGETYTIEVDQVKEFGDYTLNIGKQRPSTDITGQTGITDKLVFTDQDNVYTFQADQSGTYVFTLGDMENDYCVSFKVYDDLEYEIGGSSSEQNGSTIEAEVEKGKTYSIHVAQTSGMGNYSFTVGKK